VFAEEAVMEQPISNEALARAEKLVEAERKILAALKPLNPVARMRVLRASMILQGMDILR
jgi:hypothetical protein